MNKCCFIVPYFGKLPNYFPLFLKSCSYNMDYNWIIFTDDEDSYSLPKNVKIVKMTFEEMKILINKRVDVECNIPEMHKLCDFKPAYGLIFSDYLDNYDFWGHCDLDMIFGDINKFITNEILEKYDKIGCLGHMIMYKNCNEINRMFMKELNGKLLYKSVFTSEKTLVFDETFGGNENINSIFEQYGKKIYTDDLSFNVKIFPTKFKRVKFNYETYSYIDEKIKNAIYTWENGKIKRYYLENKKLISEEYMYIHLQQRTMKFDKSILNSNYIKIVPNEFCELEFENINIDNFHKVRKSSMCFHSITKRLEWKKKGLKRRLKKYVNK